MTCNTRYWTERIAATRAQIDAFEDAVLAITLGQIDSYTLNTGQSVQTVKRHNIAVLHTALDSLYNRLATLEARVYGCGRTVMRPDW